MGNKDDNHEKKVVPLEEAQQFADQIGIPLYETSAKEGKNVEEVFHAIARLVLKQKLETEAQEAASAGDKVVVQSGAMRGSGGGGGEAVLLLLSIACTQYVSFCLCS